MEGTDVSKRENNPIQNDMALMQASQSDLIQQVKNLQENFSHVMNEMQAMKQTQEQQAEIIKTLSNYIQQHGGQEFKLDSFETSYRKQPPSIFVATDGSDRRHLVQFIPVKAGHALSFTAQSKSKHLGF
ncbi:hypothetical protein G6F36_015781 [Rhizopus arrhizus]|nr:hypothetical protein G6F36_015781 [Rhizopus arrhizus]